MCISCRRSVFLRLIPNQLAFFGSLVANDCRVVGCQPCWDASSHCDAFPLVPFNLCTVLEINKISYAFQKNKKQTKLEHLFIKLVKLLNQARTIGSIKARLRQVHLISKPSMNSLSFQTKLQQSTVWLDRFISALAMKKRMKTNPKYKVEKPNQNKSRIRDLVTDFPPRGVPPNGLDGSRTF